MCAECHANEKKLKKWTGMWRYRMLPLKPSFYLNPKLQSASKMGKLGHSFGCEGAFGTGNDTPHLLC